MKLGLQIEFQTAVLETTKSQVPSFQQRTSFRYQQISDDCRLATDETGDTQVYQVFYDGFQPIQAVYTVIVTVCC